MLATAMHLEEELREVLGAVAMMQDFVPDAEVNTELTEDEPSFQPPRQLGEYRIIRELGRGGMGVVYEAEHGTMRRRVALKMLFPHMVERGNVLERFVREARAAGRLHHTIIVPVFEVGSIDGKHFYAMQRIRGQNLDQVIGDLSSLRANASEEKKLKLACEISVDLSIDRGLRNSRRVGVHGRYSGIFFDQAS